MSKIYVKKGNRMFNDSKGEEDRKAREIFRGLFSKHRNQAGFTQKELQEFFKGRLNLRTISNWENANSLPSKGRPKLFKEVIACLLAKGGFQLGCEREEAEKLWQASKLKEPFDNDWFEKILNESQAQKIATNWPSVEPFEIEQGNSAKLLVKSSEPNTNEQLPPKIPIYQHSDTPQRHNLLQYAKQIWIIAVLLTLVLSGGGETLKFLLASNSIPLPNNDCRLEVISKPYLTNTIITTNQTVEANYKVKNICKHDMNIDALALGVRLGETWEGPVYDFPHDNRITLKPNEIYEFRSTRAFIKLGRYFAEPVVNIDGQWGGISDFPRIYFTVIAPAN